jgi:hypothetical protein
MMKISEYIKSLEEQLAFHGDLEVETYAAAGHRVEAPPPTIGYRLILTNREWKARFWEQWEGEERKGEKVLRI